MTATREALRDALAALVADDFLAWSASAFEEYWQCGWCQARGADVDGEPRAVDHRPFCPWVTARRLLAEEER